MLEYRPETQISLVFYEAEAVLVDKKDLLPCGGFSSDMFNQNIRRINPQARVLKLSGRTGDGIDEWCVWLLGRW